MIKNKKNLIILIVVLIALALSSCAGGASRRFQVAGWAGTTVNQDTVFLAYGPEVFALNLNTGAQQWQFPAESSAGVDFYAAPILTDEGDQLIVPGYNKVLYSVDPDNGLELWAFSEAEGRYIAPVMIKDDTIYSANADNTLYALNLEGQLQWSYSTDDPLWAAPIWSDECECIYQVSMDHRLHAIDPESGNLIWKSVELGGPVISSPAITDEGLIIIGTFNNEVVALDEKTQEVAWRFQTQDWAWASAVVDGDKVYVTDISGNIYALESATGAPVWQKQPGGGIFSKPLVKDGVIYVSTDASSLVVLSTDGVIQRNTPIDGKLYASPVAADDKILLAPTDAEFYLIAQNDNGVQVWVYPQPE